MYCRACGQPMNDNQAICLSCGVKVGGGNKYCGNCGAEVNPDASVCLKCGVAIKKSTSSITSSIASSNSSDWLPEGKDKIVAIILCLLLGSLGIHNFYLGETKKGIIKIVFCVLFYISSILALIDLIKMIMDKYVVDPNKAF